MEKSLSGALIRRIPRPAIAAFLTGLPAGYAAHLFAFTNIIPNADGLSRVVDPQQMTVAGRWFLHYATVFNGFIQSPGVIGFFTVLFLALAAGFTVWLLELRSSLLGGLAGLLMAVFPPVAFTLLFLFTSSAYSFGILLAVLAVWLADRSPRRLWAAVPMLACAIGTYQAYLSVALSLVLIRLLLCALEPGVSGKTLLRRGLRFLMLLAGGLALYFLELRLFLRAKHLTLMDYKHISEMGSAGQLEQMLSRLGKTYTGFLTTRATPLALIISLAFLALGLWALIRIVVRRGLYRRPTVLISLLVLLALLPPALNLPVMLVSVIRTYMRYSLVLAYVLALALADRARELPEPEAGSRSPARILTAGAAALSLLLGAYAFNVDNLAYTASATAHRATQSFLTRLVVRVESLPGYKAGMEVVIIGSFPDEQYHSGVPELEGVDAPSYLVLSKNKHIYYYLNDWLNVDWPEPEEETFLQIAESREFDEMPLYPSQGSVVISEGRVIVKISDRYIPRRPYEEQYEARR